MRIKLRESTRSDVPGAIGNQDHRNDDEDSSNLVDSKFLRTKRDQNYQKRKYLYLKSHAELHEAFAVPQQDRSHRKPRGEQQQ